MRNEIQTEFTAVFTYCGIGGGAEGFQDAIGEWGGAVGRFKVLYGIDNDPEACQDFTNITGGAPALQLDFFTREQYIQFHGEAPPPGWRELTAADIYALSDGKTPDAKFSSSPCKGFSFLLSKENAARQKYQALNQLALRELQLYLEAFEDDPIPFMIMENVPGIMSRGKSILTEMKRLLQNAGYALHEQIFDCGIVGGLGETRRRYILVARYIPKMSAEVYLPEPKKLRTIGDVIGALPMPNDPACGPLHQLPKLSLLNASRLAQIEPGKDWRCLQDMDHTQLAITYTPRGAGAYGVQDWNKPGNTVIGNAKITGSNAAAAIADPRLKLGLKATKNNLYRVHSMNDTAPTITGAAGPSNGALCIADTRTLDYLSQFEGVYQIVKRSDELLPLLDKGDIPAFHKRGQYVVLTENGAWHRPVTTYEMAIIQGFKTHLPDGRPFQLAGTNSRAQRERIGNAVPPPSAKAWAEVILIALMASSVGAWTMGITDVWVMPERAEEAMQLLH